MIARTLAALAPAGAAALILLGSWAAPVHGQVPPATPLDVTARGLSSSQIRVTWRNQGFNQTHLVVEARAVFSGRTTDGLTGITSTIDASRLRTNLYSEVGRVSSTSTSFVHGGLASGSSWEYRVRAVNMFGSSAPSAPATAAAMPAPVAPTFHGANPTSSSSIELIWQDRSNNEAGFAVERWDARWVELARLPANTQRWVHTGLAPNTFVSYRVSAYNGGGSTPSVVRNARSFPLPPTAPSNLQAQVQSASQIRLTWQDRSNNESGFHVSRAQGTGSFRPVGSVGPNVTTYTDSGLSASTQYRYQVAAYNQGGTNVTAAVSATTHSGLPPAAPSNLQASTLGTSQINLTWTDNSADESGFRVERALGGTSVFTQVAQTPPNVTSWQNTGLQAGSYSYRVRAYGPAGNSPYSNVATATLEAPPAPTAISVHTSRDVTVIDNSTNPAAANTSYASSANSVGCNFSEGPAGSEFVCGAFALEFQGLQEQIAGRNVSRAILHLTPSATAPDRNTSYRVRPFMQPWPSPTYNTVVWYEQPSPVLFPPPTTTVSVDVTSIVRAWANGQIPNGGFFIDDQARSTTTSFPAGDVIRSTDFFSIETGFSNRPRLVVEFQN